MVHFGQIHSVLTRLLEYYSQWFGASGAFVKKERKRTGPVDSVGVAVASLTAARGPRLQLDPSDQPSVFKAPP